MYKVAVRRLIRYGIRRLNDGDASFLLRMASPDAVIAFPGNNSWATMYRPVVKGRHKHATHRGIEECRSFADRFIAEGLQLEIEDILVNGPPWHARAAVRAHDYRPGADGDDYSNRVVAFLEFRWGRLISWEDYEDTERISDWDRRRAAAQAATSSPAGPHEAPPG